MINRIYDIDSSCGLSSLWDGQYKIPWNDPAFSARMLREHLSQEHHLASRKMQAVKAQAEWIHSRYLCGETASILDIGCGPGLYAKLLAGDEHDYLGIDFSPASIEYAARKYADDRWYRFILGDVVIADFKGLHNLAIMLYGEINVFPPAEALLILKKAYDNLVSGGQLVLEVQRFETVRSIGEAPDAEMEAASGLFSDAPYVCRTESRWYEAEGVARQAFRVRAENKADTGTYVSTTKAWTNDELVAMLTDIGFTDVIIHDDWPDPADAFVLLTAAR